VRLGGVSPPKSLRLRLRIEARTCVESVRISLGCAAGPETCTSPEAAARAPSPRVLQSVDRESETTGVVEARIAQLKTQKVLPINPSAYGFSGIPVGETVGKLHDCYESKPPRHRSRLSSYREERCEQRIVEYSPDLITKG